MSFLKLAKFFLPLSALLSVASVVVFFVPGPVFSIEFTGGTLMELSVPAGTTRDEISAAFTSFVLADESHVQNVNVSPTGADSYQVRMRDISNEEHLDLLTHLTNTLGSVQEMQFTTIGPTVGETLKRRSILALAVASVAIVIYIAIAFRKIPRRLSPWSFGIIAIVSLLHDVIILTGIFVILSHTTTFQIDTLFVTALLSVMGYTVSDTIVIFDRIRENVQERGKHGGSLEELADRSLQESFSRTISTGLGALIMLSALFFFGAESIRWFVLALILGTIIGTYSSYFVATPLLVYWKKK
jgi:preprotein translocase subunit SecF